MIQYFPIFKLEFKWTTINLSKLKTVCEWGNQSWKAWMICAKLMENKPINPLVKFELVEKMSKQRVEKKSNCEIFENQQGFSQIAKINIDPMGESM